MKKKKKGTPAVFLARMNLSIYNVPGVSVFFFSGLLARNQWVVDKKQNIELLCPYAGSDFSRPSEIARY